MAESPLRSSSEQSTPTSSLHLERRDTLNGHTQGGSPLLSTMNTQQKVLIIVVIIAVIFLVWMFWRAGRAERKAEEKAEECYNRILVGTGPAGAAFANSYTGQGKKLLVLEGGKNYEDDPTIYGTDLGSMFGALAPKYTTYFKGNADLGILGQVTFMDWAKMVGGASSHNFFAWYAPTEQWCKETVLATHQNAFQYETVKYLLENVENVAAAFPGRGTAGTLYIRTTAPTTLGDMFCKATNEITGVPIVADPNSGKIDCCAMPTLQLSQTSDSPPKRVTSYGAFLAPILDKHGHGVGDRKGLLRLKTQRIVKRVLFDDNLAVKGIEYVKNGNIKTKLTKQVTLAAGTETPLILERSGIGDKTIVEAAGVKSLVNLPMVGKFLNHPGTLFVVKTTNAALIAETFGDPSSLQYSGGAFLPDVGTSSNDRRWQLLGAYFGVLLASPAILLDYGITPFDIGASANYTAFIAWDMKAKSGGSYHITGPEVTDAPSYNTAWFADGDTTNPASDISAMVRMAKQFRTIVQKMATDNPSAGFELIYPPSAAFAADALLAAYLKATFNAGDHWTGMARIGTSVTNGVCDANMNVLGVTGLSVVDNQSLPIINWGNTQAAAYAAGMIGANLQK